MSHPKSYKAHQIEIGHRLTLRANGITLQQVPRPWTFAIVYLFSKICFGSDVFPNNAEKLRSYEFGQVILMLMPRLGQTHVGWDHLSGESISWLDNGYRQTTTRNGGVNSIREGLLRIHVDHTVATVLKEKKHELAWTLQYVTDEPPKFGIKLANIQPGTSDEGCFGHLYDGCSFNPEKSLSRADIDTKKICEVSEPGTRIVGYRLSHTKRKGAYALWTSSWGSGGDSSDFSLVFDERDASICKQWPIIQRR